jgi:hypothetical protein
LTTQSIFEWNKPNCHSAFTDVTWNDHVRPFSGSDKTSPALPVPPANHHPL